MGIDSKILDSSGVEKPTPLWTCSLCNHELWDEKANDEKPIGLNVAVMSSNGEGAALPFEVCPKCRAVSLNEVVFDDLQGQMTKKIIQVPPGAKI
jgi:hypothetical protein